MKTFATLLRNELKLNLRNMNMVIFAIIMPLVILLIFGFIYGNQPDTAGAAYTFMEKSFGALCCISICAGGLMGLPPANSLPTLALLGALSLLCFTLAVKYFKWE